MGSIINNICFGHHWHENSVTESLISKSLQSHIPQLLHFRIYWYSTTSTDESVFIIGGTSGDYPSTVELSTIAEYKDGKWRKIGNMAHGRRRSISYIFGSSMKIIGGESPDFQGS